MKLYVLDTGEGSHFATPKYLEVAKQQLEEEGDNIEFEYVIDIPVSKEGVFQALRAGVAAAGGHPTRLNIFAEKEWF